MNYLDPLLQLEQYVGTAVSAAMAGSLDAFKILPKILQKDTTSVFNPKRQVIEKKIFNLPDAMTDMSGAVTQTMAKTEFLFPTSSFWASELINPYLTTPGPGAEKEWNMSNAEIVADQVAIGLRSLERRTAVSWERDSSGALATRSTEAFSTFEAYSRIEWINWFTDLQKSTGFGNTFVVSSNLYLRLTSLPNFVAAFGSGEQNRNLIFNSLNVNIVILPSATIIDGDPTSGNIWPDNFMMLLRRNDADTGSLGDSWGTMGAAPSHVYIGDDLRQTTHGVCYYKVVLGLWTLQQNPKLCSMIFVTN